MVFLWGGFVGALPLRPRLGVFCRGSTPTTPPKGFHPLESRSANACAFAWGIGPCPLEWQSRLRCVRSLWVDGCFSVVRSSAVTCRFVIRLWTVPGGKRQCKKPFSGRKICLLCKNIFFCRKMYYDKNERIPCTSVRFRIAARDPLALSPPVRNASFWALPGPVHRLGCVRGVVLPPPILP